MIYINLHWLQFMVQWIGCNLSPWKMKFTPRVRAFRTLGKRLLDWSNNARKTRAKITIYLHIQQEANQCDVTEHTDATWVTKTVILLRTSVLGCTQVVCNLKQITGCDMQLASEKVSVLENKQKACINLTHIPTSMKFHLVLIFLQMIYNVHILSGFFRLW